MKKSITRIVASFLAFALVFASVLSMPMETQAATKPTKIVLTEKSKTIYVGDKYTIKIKSVTPKNASKKVTYTSSNTKVATVDSKGKVTAKKAGSATITVKSTLNKKATAKIKFTVKTPVKKITVTNAVSGTIAVAKGKKVALKLSYEPSNASTKSATFTSKNKKVATVDSKGNVKGVKAGNTTITIKSKDGKKTTTVKVIVPKTAVKSVKLNKTSATVLVGGKVTLTPSFTPSKPTVKLVSYKSSNTKVATVDAKGNVKAVAPGTATITVTTLDGGKTAKCKVTVNPVKVTSVKLSKTALALNKGGTAVLTAAVAPANATYKTVTWTSSNNNIAAVDQRSGKVTAKGKGVATITATADGIKATCQVTVSVPASGVTLSFTAGSSTIKVGETATLSATVAPTDVSNKNVTWKSTNTAVATVVNGVITAKSVGTARITATAADGSGKSAYVDITVVSASIPVTEVKLNKAEATIKIIDTLALTAEVNTDATNKTIKWSSSNEAIATVDEDGVVTPVAAGNVTIKATADDGSGVYADCKVTVVDKVNALQADETSDWYTYLFDKRADSFDVSYNDETFSLSADSVLADMTTFKEKLAVSAWSNETLADNFNEITVDALKNKSNAFAELLFAFTGIYSGAVTADNTVEDTVRVHVVKGENIRDLTIVRTDAAEGKSTVTITDENSGKVVVIENINITKNNGYTITATIKSDNNTIDVAGVLSSDGNQFTLYRVLSTGNRPMVKYTNTDAEYKVEVNKDYYAEMLNALGTGKNPVELVTINNIYVK